MPGHEERPTLARGSIPLRGPSQTQGHPGASIGGPGEGRDHGMTMDEQSQAEQLETFDEQDGGIHLEDMPPERPWGAAAYGAGGTETPDTVAARSAREEPDVLPLAEEPAAGLYENEDGFAADDEAQAVALLQDEVPGTLSAEEAAVHLVSEDDAVTYGGLDPDGPIGDGYVDPADT